MIFIHEVYRVIEKSTSYIKAFESYRLTDRETKPKSHTTPLRRMVNKIVF